MQARHLLLVAVVVVLLAAGAALASEPAEITAALIRVEESLASGWLRHYDYNQHRDLGAITTEYFAARSRLSPESLVELGLLADKSVLDALRTRWRDLPAIAEAQPIAVDFVAAGGVVKATTFTRVQMGRSVDVYILSVELKDGVWVLDTCGLTAGLCAE